MPKDHPELSVARQRIQAITGQPIERGVAIHPQEAFVQRLHDDLRSRIEVRKQHKRSCFPAIRKLLEVAGIDYETLSPATTIRPLQLSPPSTTTPSADSAILLGSLEAVLAPPYDYSWATGFGGNHGDWTSNTDPTSLQEYSANKNSGDLFVHSKVVREDFNSAYAGLGIHYRPLTNGYKRFRFGANWDFLWSDQSQLLTANNDGYVRISVYEYDLQGQFLHAVVNQQFQQWSDGTGWYEHHDGSGIGLAGGFESMPFPASADKRYVLWAWCSCEVQSDDEDGNGIFPVNSFAEAMLRMHIPAMSIKEA